MEWILIALAAFWLFEQSSASSSGGSTGGGGTTGGGPVQGAGSGIATPTQAQCIAGNGIWVAASNSCIAAPGTNNPNPTVLPWCDANHPTNCIPVGASGLGATPWNV